jgi:acyl-CoA dehydrogenase
MQTLTRPRTDASFDALLSRVHEIGRDVVAPAAADVDRDARFPREAIDALRAVGLLGAYVAEEYGGAGLSMTQIARICEVLGRYCASTAMVYAMHQIQVACILHHGGSSTFFREYLAELAGPQPLLASATTELGVGGDLRASHCAVDVRDGRFTLEKKAPVISYGLESDAILATARRSPEAGPGDQVLVVVHRGETELEPLSGWDTLGFRGTCSLGFVLRGAGDAAQILPEPFADVLARTMHPFSHMVWGSLWLGLASDAADRARASVRDAARKQSGVPEVPGLRLTELDEVLFRMRAGLYGTMAEYQRLLDAGEAAAFRDYGFAIRVNNVKVSCSELVVDVVGRALRIVGIAGYRNDSSKSLTRHLRDAHGAALMVNNDRIRGHNAALQVMQRQGAE